MGVHVPVYKNRSIETWGTLLSANNTELFKFRAHAKGQTPRNCLTSNGDTPTGLMAFNLETPEDDPVSYGPYPINRAAYGISVLGGAQTNAELMLGVSKPASSIRSGILL